MNKIYILFALVLGFFCFANVGTTHAQVVGPTATSSGMYAGGFGTTCFYLRQIHEGETGYSCDDNATETAAIRFSTNPIFREFTLTQWRARWLVPHN